MVIVRVSVTHMFRVRSAADGDGVDGCACTRACVCACVMCLQYTITYFTQLC